jgi:hypothetical protein
MIQPWTSGQVRLSWPITGGFNLQRSSSPAGGFTNLALTVFEEAGAHAAYDIPGEEAAFYRLVK